MSDPPRAESRAFCLVILKNQREIASSLHTKSQRNRLTRERLPEHEHSGGSPARVGLEFLGLLPHREAAPGSFNSGDSSKCNAHCPLL